MHIVPEIQSTTFGRGTDSMASLLVLARFCIGFIEATVFPGILFYLSLSTPELEASGFI